MTKKDAYEFVYKNGYEAGKADRTNTISAIQRKYESMWVYAKTLEEQVEKLTAERDAALADLEKIAKKLNYPCHWCGNAYDADPTLCVMCDEDEKNGNFEWRGVQEEKE